MWKIETIIIGLASWALVKGEVSQPCLVLNIVFGTQNQHVSGNNIISPTVTDNKLPSSRGSKYLV